MKKRIAGFLLTGIILVSIVYFLSLSSQPGLFLSGFNPTFLFFLLIFSPVILISNCLLMLYFNSTRLFYMNWLILLTYLYYSLPGISNYLNFDYFSPGFTMETAVLYPYFLPVLIFIVHLTAERGFLNLPGFIKLVLFSIFSFGPLLVQPLGGTEIAQLHGRLPVFQINSLAVSPIFLLLIVVFGLVLIFIRERSFYGKGQELIFWAVVAFSLVPFFQDQWWNEQVFIFSPVVSILYGFGSVVMAGRGINFAWGKAYLDKLTLVEGRLALDEHLERLSGDYALAMVDIDNFKTFNDKYGHDSGDVVLQQVADILEYYSTGHVYRFGGEEFTVVYPRSLAAEAEEELEELRERVGSNKVGVTRKSKRATKVLEKKVTISIGLADSSGRFENPHEVLNAADNALYKAKEEGRNKLCKK